jgi:hypothetical protein
MIGYYASTRIWLLGNLAPVPDAIERVVDSELNTWPA